MYNLCYVKSVQEWLLVCWMVLAIWVFSRGKKKSLISKYLNVILFTLNCWNALPHFDVALSGFQRSVSWWSATSWNSGAAGSRNLLFGEWFDCYGLWTFPSFSWIVQYFFPTWFWKLDSVGSSSHEADSMLAVSFLHMDTYKQRSTAFSPALGQDATPLDSCHEWAHLACIFEFRCYLYGSVHKKLYSFYSEFW